MASTDNCRRQQYDRGWTWPPTCRAEIRSKTGSDHPAKFVTDADRRAFSLADNRIAELSTWDRKLMTEELTVLFEGGYELEITGFSTADLDFSVPEQRPKMPSEEVELPDPDSLAVCCSGDLWHIGEHRLYCGDAPQGGQLGNATRA